MGLTNKQRFFFSHMTKNPKSGQPLSPAHQDSGSISLHIGFIFLLVTPWLLQFQTLSR